DFSQRRNRVNQLARRVQRQVVEIRRQLIQGGELRRIGIQIEELQALLVFVRDVELLGQRRKSNQQNENNHQAYSTQFHHVLTPIDNKCPDRPCHWGMAALQSSTFVSKWIDHAIDSARGVHLAALVIPACRSGLVQVKRNQIATRHRAGTGSAGTLFGEHSMCNRMHINSLLWCTSSRIPGMPRRLERGWEFATIKS